MRNYTTIVILSLKNSLEALSDPFFFLLDFDGASRVVLTLEDVKMKKKWVLYIRGSYGKVG